MGQTQAGWTFVLTSSHYDSREPSELPCSDRILSDSFIQLLSFGPALSNGPSDPSKFFEFCPLGVAHGCGLEWSMEDPI